MIAKNPYTSYKNIFLIAWPIMLGSLGQNFIYLVDTSFIGRVGEADMGGSAIGGIYYFLLFNIGYAMNIGMQVMIARRKGEGNNAAIGEVLDHQLRMVLLLGTVEFILMHFLSGKILASIIQSDIILEKAAYFLHYRSYGILFGLLNSCFMSFFIGIGNTRVTVWTTGAMVGINIFFLYCFVFGNFGFPVLGVGGAGLASSIAEASVTAVFIIYFLVKKFRIDYHLFQFTKIKFKLIISMLNLATPLMFQQVISVGSWWLFFLAIEHLGEHPLAISNLVRGLYTFYGIPVWALASTVNSMTSNLLGQGKPDDVIPLIKKVSFISIGFSVFFGLLINIFPVATLSVYTNDKDLIIDSIPTLRTLTFAIALFSFSILTIFAVSGSGATKVSLLIEIVAIVFYVSYTIVSAVVLHWSLPAIWLAESVYWIVTFVMCAWYLKNGRWMDKKI
ncbi:MAG: MATE family efflux transporter [Chitinophagaceae bacterium]|nr:MATE family efflux transporter [Chitinophagaceae bacterium]